MSGRHQHVRPLTEQEKRLRQLSRREFIRLAGLAAGLFALPRCGDDADESTMDTGASRDTGAASDSLDGGSEGAIDSGSVDGDTGGVDGEDGAWAEEPPYLPSLGGAPDTPDGRAVAAFVDTIIPGAHRDPTGAPGAIDVDAAALFFDPALPALPLVPVLVLTLDGEARISFGGRSFVELSSDERDEALTLLLQRTDLLGFAVQLAKLAYYSSRGAGDHLGYPGANPGYVDHPYLSFRRPMAREITEDGNYD